MDVFDLFAKISLDTSGYEGGLASAQDKFQAAGQTLSTVGAAMTKTVSLPLAGIGAAIIKTGADYEAGMSKVQAISGATGEEMDALSGKAMEMAAQTKFSTAESAEAYQYMAMAGWKSGEMVDGLSGIMNLAAASGESLATTSDIVTDALTAFGLSASDSGHFADVLAVASSNSNTNVAMMGETFKYVAPVAGALGFSVEDVSAAIGLMANSGIKAGQAGTALRSMFTRLAKPTKETQGALDMLGVSLTNSDGTMKSLSEVMADLRAGFSGLSEAEQAQIASSLAGQEAMSGLLAIVNASDADVEKLTAAIGAADGTAAAMAETMNNNASGAVTMLMSAVNVLFTSLSEFLIPAFTGIVRTVTDTVNGFNSLDDHTKKLILTIGGIAIAAGPVLTVAGKIITSVGTIGTGITKLMSLGGSLAKGVKALWALFTANPIALVVVAIAGLVAAFAALWNNCEAFREFWLGLWESISAAASAAWAAITGFFTAAWETIQSVWSAAVAFFAGIADGISAAFSETVAFFHDIFTAAWETVQAVWGIAVDFFAGVGDGIQTVVAAACEAIALLFSAAWEAAKAVWDTVVGFFTEVGEGVRAVFEAVTGAISAAFQAAWESVRSAWEAAAAFFQGIWKKIEGAFSGAAGFFGGVFSKAWSAVTSAWSGAAAFFQNVWENIKNVFSGVWEHFKSIGGNIVGGIREGISGAWDSFLGWLSSRVDGIVDFVKNLLGIHSPSAVFAGIGGNMALGLGAGWDDEYSRIKRQIEGGMQFAAAPVHIAATVDAPAAGRVTGDGGGRAGDVYNFYSPKALDPVSAAREMKKARQQMAMGFI